jgi:MYXO-CTERM domain-containing protein
MTTDAGLMYFGPATPFSTGQTITRGTALPAVTITPTVTTGTNIADDNAAIGAELTAQIAAGKLPTPTYDAQGYPNTIYFVFFPSNYSITLQNMQSCGAFGGYHYSTPYTAPAACKGQYVPYAVIPDCGSDTTGLSSICSHELAEAVSDTDVGPTSPPTSNYGDGAWYLGPSYPCNSIQNCPQTCGEVGDVCQSAGDSTVPGTSIISQDIWSQAQNGCGVNNPATGPQPTPAGPPVTICTAPAPDAGSPDAGTTPDAGKPPGDGGGVGPGADASVGPTRDGGSPGPTGGADSGGGPGAGADASTGGNGDTPGSSTGCACSTTPDSTSGGLAGMAAGLLGLTLLGRLRRRARR